MLGKTIAAAAVIAALGAAAWWQFFHKPEAELKQARSAVLAALKDPDSAQFRNERLRQNVLCGELNSRNSMGGYVGFTRFVSAPADYALEGSGMSRWEATLGLVGSSQLLRIGLEAQTAHLSAILKIPEELRVKPSRYDLDEIDAQARFEYVWKRFCV